MGLIVKRRVTLDLSRRGQQVTVPFSVGDRVAHEVIFTLRDGSELIELPPGVTAAITIKNGYKYTDNGTGCVDACVIDHVNNTITYTPTVEALSIEGNIECTLHVFDADDAVIGAPTFIFAVSEGDNANTEREVGDALVASPSWGIIAKAEKNAKKAAAEAERAEEAADRAETGGLTIAQVPGDNDKAVMSQKAVTDELAKKWDTPKNKNKSYDEMPIVRWNDVVDCRIVTTENIKNAIPIRGKDGCFKVGTPTDGEHATPRSYVDSKIYDKIAEIIAKAPSDLDTLKEIADYIASDKTNAAEINSKLSKHEREILDNRTAIKNLPELVQETGDREDAVMSQKAATDAIENILHPISYSGTVEPVSPAFTKIYVASGITLKKGKSYIFRVTATTNLTTFAAHAYIRRGDTSLYYLNPKAGALSASLRFTATEELDNVAITIEFSVTSGASAEWSFEEDTHFVVRQSNPSNNACYYAYCNSNNKVDVELLKVSHEKNDWSIARRYGGSRLRVGTPVEDDDATPKNYVDLRISEAIGGSGSGNVTLYRHTAAFGIYNKGGLTSNVQGIDFAFSYISTDGTPFPETVEGIYNWIMANGFLPCSGYINEDGKQYALYGLQAYGANDGYRCLEVFTENHSGGAGIHDTLDEPNFTYAGIDVYYHTTTQI